MVLKILCLLCFLIFSNELIVAAGSIPFFDSRIVNGEDVEGEITYQVSLQNKGSSFHFCGGMILNNNYVITAAHCVQSKSAGLIKVVAATTNLLDPKSEHNVAKIIVHSGYNSTNSLINDIALLKVSTPFKTSATLGHVPLPPKDHVVKANDVAVVSGWGRLWQGGPTTAKLQRVDIFIADQAYCKYLYNNIGLDVYPTQVCAYDAAVKKGSCHGDSGGPLTVNGKLVGLVSWGFGCASTFYPTVYTRVSFYLDWIKDNTV